MKKFRIKLKKAHVIFLTACFISIVGVVIYLSSTVHGSGACTIDIGVKFSSDSNVKIVMEGLNMKQEAKYTYKFVERSDGMWRMARINSKGEIVNYVGDLAFAVLPENIYIRYEAHQKVYVVEQSYYSYDRVLFPTYEETSLKAISDRVFLCVTIIVALSFAMTYLMASLPYILEEERAAQK